MFETKLYQNAFWEWRVFYPSFTRNEVRPDIRLFTQLEIKEETRTDYYYLLDTSKFGLKERGCFTDSVYTPILELKARLSRTSWGAELWTKCFQKKFSSGITEPVGIPTNTIIQSIQEASLNTDKEDAKSLRSLLQHLRGDIPFRTPIFKTRRRSINRYSIETGTFYPVLERDLSEDNRFLVTFEDAKIQCFGSIWGSFSVEAPSLDILEEIRHRFRIRPGWYVMGYPEFIRMSVKSLSSE